VRPRLRDHLLHFVRPFRPQAGRVVDGAATTSNLCKKTPSNLTCALDPSITGSLSQQPVNHKMGDCSVDLRDGRPLSEAAVVAHEAHDQVVPTPVITHAINRPKKGVN
jgi:hypothetical protein